MYRETTDSRLVTGAQLQIRVADSRTQTATHDRATRRKPTNAFRDVSQTRVATRNGSSGLARRRRALS